MMFSQDYWYEPNPQFGTPHPENEAVFGSFRDYWSQMSKGKFRIQGKVVNPDTTGDGVPEWIMADTTRPYYADPTIFIYGDDSLANEAIYKANQYGYITDTPGPKYYDKLVVVYAQFARITGALMVHAQDIGGKFIILGERSGPDLFGGLSEDKSFTHIGIYAHELAHTFGLYDEYTINDYEDGGTDLRNFCLMARGIFNGPDRKAACPSTLSPYYRINYGWLPQSTIINSDTMNFLVEYDYNNPKIYRINPIDAPGNMHYLFEVRHRDGFDLYIPAPPETFPNEQLGTLIIWQDSIESNLNPGNTTPYTDRIRIKPADYLQGYTFQSQLNDFFPSEGYQNYQTLNDTTKPTASFGDLYDEASLIFVRPAHFELKGIHKLQDHNTEIDEIKLSHAIIKNNISGNWQSVSVGAILSDYSANYVYPSLIDETIYDYIPGQGYILRDTLRNGPGYWAKFGPSQSIAHAGLILDSLNIPVKSSWNLIGSISDKVPKLNICTEPPGIIISMYYYDGGYHYLTNSDSLKPGRGYWLNSTSDGNVILLRNFECPESEEFNLAEMDKFIITDADGKTQDLYVANADIDTSITGFDRSLPPPFLEIDFDARFNYGEFIKAVSVDSGEVDLEIDVHTYAYPVTLSWEINPANGIEYSFISDSGFSKISIINSIHKKLTISENSEGKITLFGKVNNSSNTQMPQKFELLQNYPNPFNPVTTIKFLISKESQVNLSVFNILGEKVKELKNEVMKPGYYEINFDASLLASGIYFYRIQADAFVQTKKMILMK
jgi:M6 family metalloprotease-like protein